MSLHAVFAGNPGTGKTTVARIYADILKEIGYLSSGHLIEADRSKLVSEYVGQTAIKTTGLLEKALGGVLFIDEAYALKSHENDTFGQESIDTLLKFIEDNRQELIVILAGYRDRMESLLDSNPGFRSRFSQFVTFEDYTDEELGHILVQMAQDMSFEIPSQVVTEAIAALSTQRAGRYFANARAVRNLLESAIRHQAMRLSEQRHKTGKEPTREDLIHLQGSDFSCDETSGVATAMEQLDSLVGLSQVKATIREYRSLIEVAGLRKQNPRDLLQPNFVMLGNPGTGKTTVARLMGRIFRELGYLPTDRVVEVDRSQLIAGYLGQTALKTRSALEKALGGTIFIDEAYALARDSTGVDYGHEAIETLLKFMEDNRGRLVVIVAGYEHPMQTFLGSNPGLRSRFTNFLHFSDYSSTECAQLLLQEASSHGFTVEPNIAIQLITLFDGLRVLPGWANGRDVRTLVELAARQQALRVSTGGPCDAALLAFADIATAGKEESVRRPGTMAESSYILTTQLPDCLNRLVETGKFRAR
jgi:AAA+ superfamily predicted ATPase